MSGKVCRQGCNSHLLYLYLWPIFCHLEQCNFCRKVHYYIKIAQAFSGSINIRGVICCNHARSIASGGGEPFHILWIHPSLYTQWRQFKCKSWHSHHSATQRLLYQKLRCIGPRSKWATICTTVHLMCVLKCVREGVQRNMVTDNERESDGYIWRSMRQW